MKADTEPPSKGKAPSRYRKVEVRTWGDEKFRRLSALPPSGKGLWLYLITGPHTGPIPGLFRASRAAMAEELGWTTEQFGERFAELFREGMATADFEARVMWIPQAIKHNRPDNPNVVKSWAAEFDLIPESALKVEAWNALRASVYALGEQFGKAFDDSLPNPSFNGSTNGSANGFGNGRPNQEQQQQQQPKEQAPLAPVSSADADSSSATPTTDPPTEDLESGQPQLPSIPPSQRVKAKKPRATPTIPCPYAAIYGAYHELLPDLPRVRLMDNDRRHAAMRKVWGWVLSSKKTDGTPRASNADEGIQWFREFFERASHNDFLMGRTKRPESHANWFCDFDFLLTDRGIKHVIERTDPHPRGHAA